MLSRANSDAGNRLRRAKSSSLAQHKPIEPQGPLSVDPRHAEVAAVEAYRRACRQEQQCQPQQSAKPQRRRSQGSRRSEGSHFEDSRNNSRLKASQGGPSRTDSTKRPELTSRTSYSSTPAEYDGGKIIARPRKVVDTSGVTDPAKNGATNRDENRKVHKSRSMYTNHATLCAPIDSETSRRSSILPDTPYRSVLEISNDSSLLETSESRISSTTRRPTRETQTEDEIKAAAWDAYLQGFHNKSIQGRKSFVAPIKKRFSKAPSPAPMVQYDSSVPPYNFANESDDMFTSPSVPPVEITKPTGPAKLKKNRVVSESLKSKFKRILGRSKRVQTCFPAQHVEAKSLHFDVYKTQDDSFSAGSEFGVNLPRSPFSSLGTSSSTRKSSANSGQSGGDVRSRVTSWTNSTTAGTIGTTSQGNGLSSIDEITAVEGLDPASKEFTGSFLGRALRFPLRRQSQVGLARTSKDSQQLYDALRKRIEGPGAHLGDDAQDQSERNETVPRVTIREVTPPQSIVGLEEVVEASLSLPKTIRAVTPEPQDQAMVSSRIPGPPERPAPGPPVKVIRKPSWWNLAVKKNSSTRTNEESDAPSLRTKKRLTSGPTAPSKEQIAARVERSENRWQSALEGDSPILSRALNYRIRGDNPYELQPLDGAIEYNSLPMAVRHENPPPHDSTAQGLNNDSDVQGIREHVISPSVYSRASGCRSITPDAGMFITVTGREVKRYSLESPPRAHKASSTYMLKPSNEWKSWLNKEMEDFDVTPAPEEFNLEGHGSLPGSCMPPVVVTEMPVRGYGHDHNCELGSKDDMKESKESLVHPQPIQTTKTRRPELRAKTSSIMNERYPMIDTGRPPSRTTGRRTTPSSGNSIGQRTVSGSSSSQTENRSTEAERRSDTGETATVRRSGVRERQSTSALVRSRKHSSLGLRAARHSHDLPSRVTESAGGKNVVKAPKSALDLRAMYRSNRSLEPSSLDIRRKPISTVLLEDQTLRRISEGPYAADIDVHTKNKENAMPAVNTDSAATTKGTGGIDGVTIPPFYMSSARMSPSRSSANASGSSLGARGMDSPGKRMVDDFLNSRKAMPNSSPAFI